MTTRDLKKIYPWHESAFSRLYDMLMANRVSPALLITGMAGIGKLSIALRFIMLFFCNNKKSDAPCGHCGPCIALAQDDIGYNKIENELLVRQSYNESVVYCCREANKNNKLADIIHINQVRAFCNTLNRTSAKSRIGLLWYGDELRADGNDSLLKTLEEPPTDTKIIILAKKKHSLPQTLTSRCQNIHINPNYDNKTIKWLEDSISDKNIDAYKLLKLNYGAPIAALNMQRSNDYSNYMLWQEYLLILATKPNQITKKMPNNVNIAFSCLRNILITIIKNKLTKKEHKKEKITNIANKANIDFLLALLIDVEKSIQLQHTNINISLLLDSILIVWSHITHLASYPKIIE